MRGILALSLLSPALLAQAPAPQTLAQRVAAEAKAIETLRHEHPVEALEKAKALLPAAKLPFDKASLNASLASIKEWNAQIELYRMITNAAVAAGHFEEAKDAAEKGRDMAKELQGLGMASFDAYRAMWTKAGAEAAKVLEEIKELEAKVAADKATPPKAGVSMEEANALLVQQAAVAQRLALLKANEATLKDNLERSKSAVAGMAPLERPIQGLDAKIKGFEEDIALWDKYLKSEAEDIAGKYKGDKVKYAAGLLRGVAPKPEDTYAALVSLHRAAFLDPSNGAIRQRIDQLMGRAAAPAAKPAKAARGKAKRK